MAAQDDVQAHNQEVLAALEPGDLIEFNRGLFSHWAVNVGDGQVIHLAGDGNKGNSGGETKTSVSPIKAEHVFVRRDDFWSVAGNSQAKKNNKNDEKWSPYDVETIDETAKKMIGKEFDITVLTENCADFANFCRYGKSESDLKDILAMAAQDGVQTHNKKVLDDLKEGDLVEFDRGLYSHWAVYVGQKKVIHVTDVEQNSMNAKGSFKTSVGACIGKKACVRLDDFFEVAGDSNAMKNNIQDKNWTPLSAEEIVATAKLMDGKEFDYNIMIHNCEHFATLLRYGQQKSQQVRDMIDVLCASIDAAAHDFRDREKQRRNTEGSGTVKERTPIKNIVGCLFAGAGAGARVVLEQEHQKYANENA